MSSSIVTFFVSWPRIPDLVHLDLGAGKIHHDAVEQLLTCQADLDHEAHDRVAGNTRHALDRANRDAFHDRGDAAICMARGRTFDMGVIVY